MLNGAHDGSSISSGGRFGVPLHSHWPNNASQILVKTRHLETPPRLRYELARRGQCRGVGLMPRQLQREIALHAGADISGCFVILPPRTVRLLLAEDVVGQFPPTLRVIPSEKMAQHQVLGFHGRVRLQLPPPVAVRLLRVTKVRVRLNDRALNCLRHHWPLFSVHSPSNPLILPQDLAALFLLSR